jgi:hypothetical protein
MQPKVEYNKKPLLVPMLFILVGTMMLFFAPDPTLQLIGGLLAFLGMLVGFILTTLVISFHVPTKSDENTTSRE